MARLERPDLVVAGDAPPIRVLRGARASIVVTGDLIAGDVAAVGDRIAGIGADLRGGRGGWTGRGLTLVPGVHRQPTCMSKVHW